MQVDAQKNQTHGKAYTMEAAEAALFSRWVVWVEEFAIGRFHLSWRGVLRLPETCGVLRDSKLQS